MAGECLYPVSSLSQERGNPTLTQARWCLQRVEHMLVERRGRRSGRERVKLIFHMLEHVSESHPELLGSQTVYLWEQLAWEYYLLSDLPGAERCLRRQAGLQPGMADAYLNMGFMWSQAGAFSKAIDCYWEGLNVDPNDPYVVYNLACLYEDSGQQAEAVAMIEQAIAQAKEPGILYKIKGDILLHWEDFGGASMSYEKALDSASEEFCTILDEVWFKQATCYKELGHLSEACKVLEKYAAYRRQSFHAVQELAVIYEMLDDHARACEYAERALKLCPTSIEMCELLSRSYAVLGDESLAKWYSRRAEQEERKFRTRW